MTVPLRPLTPAERVAALADRGVVLYVEGRVLRARCDSTEARHLLENARPAIARHREALVAYLSDLAERGRGPHTIDGGH